MSARSRSIALRQSIDGEEEQLRHALRALRTSVAETTDPRRMVARRPYPWLAAAAGVGFALACWQAAEFRSISSP